MTKPILLCADCEGTRKQLSDCVDLIDRLGIAVNFFYVGETARDFPEIIQHTAQRHQIESHTATHTPLRGLPLETQRREIIEGKDMVEQVIGRPTHGFRAPCHAIDRHTVQVLNEEGFIFDASGLYYRYNMRGVIEIRPSWFREWMPLYGYLGISPRVAFGIFKMLFKLCNPVVLPLHPHYTGLSQAHLDAFADFVKWAQDHDGEFMLIHDWLGLRQFQYDAKEPITPRALA